MKNKYLPINIIQTMFNKRKTHLLLTFLKLQSVKNSWGQVDISDFRGLSNKLGLSPRSLKSHIIDLKKIGYLKDGLNNPNQIIVTSVWIILDKILSASKSENNTNFKKLPLRWCVDVSEIDFTGFSHKNLGLFNAFLSECIIEQMLKSKCESEKEIAIIEEIISQVVDTNSHIEELKFKIKNFKESQSKLLWMKNYGNFGKSQENIKEDLIRNKTKLDFCKKILLAYKGKISWESLPENVQHLKPAFELETQVEQSPKNKCGLGRESSDSEETFKPKNLNKLWKELTEENLSNSSGRFDTSLSWTKSLLNRSVTSVIKYRRRLLGRNLASSNPVNLNKSTEVINGYCLVNYYYPFKLVKSGYKLDKLTAESIEDYYKLITDYNKTTTKSRLIMTKAGIKEIFSSQRSSQIKIKKVRSRV